jgi:hypothetical protein
MTGNDIYLKKYLPVRRAIRACLARYSHFLDNYRNFPVGCALQ